MKNDEKTLHQKFTVYGQNAKLWMRKCELLLPKIDKHKIWEKKGFTSIYEYAAKLAGMSRNKVNEALRVLNKVENKPELQKIIEEKGINSVKPVVTIATKETAGFWAEKAKEMSQHTLETYVREVRRSGFAEEKQELHTETSGLRAEAKKTKEITMELPEEMADQLQKLKGSSEWKDLMSELLKLREEKLKREREELEKEMVRKARKKLKKTESTRRETKTEELSQMADETKQTQKVLDKANNTKKPSYKTNQQIIDPFTAKSRYIPKNIKEHILKQTNSTCGFPKCNKPYANFHHTDRFSLEKSHKPEQLVPLCQEHHKIAHHGLIQNEDLPPQYWKILKQPNKSELKFAIDQKVIEQRKQHQHE